MEGELVPQGLTLLALGDACTRKLLKRACWDSAILRSWRLCTLWSAQATPVSPSASLTRASYISWRLGARALEARNIACCLRTSCSESTRILEKKTGICRGEITLYFARGTCLYYKPLLRCQRGYMSILLSSGVNSCIPASCSLIPSPRGRERRYASV